MTKLRVLVLCFSDYTDNSNVSSKYARNFLPVLYKSKVLLKELDLGLINEIQAFKRCKKFPNIFWFHVKCRVNALGTRASSELGSHLS
jgi:hypothetical protein